MKKFVFLFAIILACIVVGCEESDTEVQSDDVGKLKSSKYGGSFSALNYNVAGLLFVYCCGDPVDNTTIIGQKLNNYSIVNVQEDFNYHSTLYDNANHPYRTPTSGGMAFGDGLNTMSDYPFTDLVRVKWDKCNGADCLTPKGFSLKRIQLEEGVYIDLYNVHANAGSTSADYQARRANITQLVNYINANSAGNAVLVMGDFNCRYTRLEDNIRLLRTSSGLTDAWVQMIKNGEEPVSGNPAMVCPYGNILSDFECEVVDKIFYRSNNYVELVPTQFSYADHLFRKENGEMLSDHYPLLVNFDFNLNSSLKMSDQFGGPHGTSFTNVNNLPAAKVSRIGLRAGRRVDQVNISFSDGTSFHHGGGGGQIQFLDLNENEVIKSVTLCSGKYKGTTRIFYARFETSYGRSVAGGRTTSETVTYTAPDGWQIVGFHGRAGSNVDKLGVIYAPI
jgi:endonuclease/exonuclease/phosphatase family metal-dependent hydrolase